MKFNYTEEDVKSVFTFLKDKPNSTFDEWLALNKSSFTEKEKELLKFVKISKIIIPYKNKEGILYFIKWDGVGGGWFKPPFKIFLNKFFKKDYFEFYNFEYKEHLLVTDDEEFINDEDNWEDGEFKGLKQLNHKINDVDVVITDDYSLEEEDANRYDSWSEEMQRKNCSFWNDEMMNVYISNIDKLEFKSALEMKI